MYLILPLLALTMPQGADWIYLLGLMLLIVAAGTVLWITALVSCVRNESTSGPTMLLWILIITFSHGLGGLAYLYNPAATTDQGVGTVMSKTTNWNIGIQILRGVAALLLVFHHSLEETRAISETVAPKWLVRFGACGVDIFFIISGFIIYSVTYGRNPRNPESALVSF